MITKSKQAWAPGATVKVGFVANLFVVALAGEAYVLSRNCQFYSFVPHLGLNKIDLVEARDMITAAKQQAERIAAKAIAQAAESARHTAVLNELMFD